MRSRCAKRLKTCNTEQPLPATVNTFLSLAARATSLGLQSRALPFWDRDSLVIQHQNSALLNTAEKHRASSDMLMDKSHISDRRETAPRLIADKLQSQGHPRFPSDLQGPLSLKAGNDCLG